MADYPAEPLLIHCPECGALWWSSSEGFCWNPVRCYCQPQCKVVHPPKPASFSHMGECRRRYVILEQQKLRLLVEPRYVHTCADCGETFRRDRGHVCATAKEKQLYRAPDYSAVRWLQDDFDDWCEEDRGRYESYK